MTMGRLLGQFALLVLAAALGAGAVLGVQRWQGGAAAGDDVRAYLLDHPEVLPEAMQVLRARETAKLVAANRPAIFTAFPGAVAGNPQGDVTIVAFMDYACGYCRASLPELDRLLAADPKIRVVYRELPILSEASGRAAQWSLAAAQQGRFLQFHKALYAGGPLTDASIAAAAQVAGLDVARAKAALSTAPVLEEVERNIGTARALGVNATPTWVIGDTVLSGLLRYDELVKAVAKARGTD